MNDLLVVLVSLSVVLPMWMIIVFSLGDFFARMLHTIRLSYLGQIFCPIDPGYRDSVADIINQAKIEDEFFGRNVRRG
jgi:hypothetical protein